MGFQDQRIFKTKHQTRRIGYLRFENGTIQCVFFANTIRPWIFCPRLYHDIVVYTLFLTLFLHVFTHARSIQRTLIKRSRDETGYRSFAVCSRCSFTQSLASLVYVEAVHNDNVCPTYAQVQWDMV